MSSGKKCLVKVVVNTSPIVSLMFTYSEGVAVCEFFDEILDSVGQILPENAKDWRLTYCQDNVRGSTVFTIINLNNMKTALDQHMDKELILNATAPSKVAEDVQDCKN